MEFKNNIKQALLKERPKLSDKSLTSYVSTLSNLPRNMANENPTNVKYFTDKVDQIIKFLKDKPARSRKSVLSPLVVLTGLEKYRKIMKEDIEKYNEISIQQKKTEKEEVNWMTWEKVMVKHDELKAAYSYAISKKQYVHKPVMDKMNDFILLSLYVLMPPRRALDYAALKYKDFDSNKDNFIDFKKKQIVFNKYKTFRTYGKQTFDVPPELLKYIKKWVKLKPQDGYVIDTNDHSTNDVTKQLNAIFKPKKVSVNMLRHSYLTHFYGNQAGTPPLTVISELAEKMGHSVEMSLKYIKK